jgi:ATP-dependent Clp protease adaptor protein ClpS
MNPSIKELDRSEEQLLDEECFNLVVFNDDVNTFEHVIQTLIEVCNHDPQQAEQCTWLIHYKGKCTVKHGAFDEMAKMCEAICNRGISAEVY